MEKNKTKIKYLLGIWKNLDNYPTEEDLEYEIESHLKKDNKSTLEFTSINLKSIFGTGWEKSKTFDVFNKMINSGKIIETGKESETRKKYKLIK